VVAVPAPGIQTSWVIPALNAATSDMAARGLRFGTVSEFAGRPVQGLSPSATGGTRLAGTTLLWLITIERFLAEWIGFLVGFVLVASVARAVIGAALAIRHGRREERRIDPELQESFDRAAAMGVPGPSATILIPARNESTVIEAAIRDVVASARRLSGSWEIIVIDDASTDATAGLADRAFRAALGSDRSGSGRVVNGPGVGKAGALDTGLAFAVGEFVIMLDADSSPNPDALVHLIGAFADPTVGAVCGRMRVGNPRGRLAWCQVVEYAMANAIERRMFSEFGVMSCVPGAIGAYRRSALDEIGPIPADTIAEDTDLTLTLQRAGWRVEFEPRSNATTLVSTGFRSFWNQRLRWATGILQNVAKHRGMFGRSTTGTSGARVAWLLPYLCVFGGLSILGPLVDATALVALLGCPSGDDKSDPMSARGFRVIDLSLVVGMAMAASLVAVTVSADPSAEHTEVEVRPDERGSAPVVLATPTPVPSTQVPPVPTFPLTGLPAGDAALSSSVGSHLGLRRPHAAETSTPRVFWWQRGHCADGAIRTAARLHAVVSRRRWRLLAGPVAASAAQSLRLAPRSPIPCRTGRVPPTALRLLAECSCRSQRGSGRVSPDLGDDGWLPVGRQPQRLAAGTERPAAARRNRRPVAG